MASTRSVRICGIAFALIFTAYNTAQNYMTTLLGAKLGSAVLVCVYGGLIVVTPLAPAAAPSLGIAPTLAAGGLTYAGLMGALLIRAVGWLPDALSTALVLIAATLNGCGGAMLWSAQGSLVILETRPEASDGGRQSGDFWALFHLSTICGNALAFWGFTEGGSPALLFGMFLAIALLGVGLFACVRPAAGGGDAAGERRDGAVDGAVAVVDPAAELVATARKESGPAALLAPEHPRSEHEHAPAAPPDASSAAATAEGDVRLEVAADGGGGGRRCAWAVAEARAMGGVFARARSLCPILFVAGGLMSYQFGVFPLSVRRADVGAVFVVFGCGEVGGAWLCGRHVERVGPRRYRLLTMVATAASLSLALPSALDVGDDARLVTFAQPARMALQMLAAFLFGVSDSAIAVLAYTDLGRAFRGRAASARAGALRQVMYSLGFLVGFGVGPYVQPAWQLAALALALGAAWAVRAREENGLRFEEISIETLRPR